MCSQSVGGLTLAKNKKRINGMAHLKKWFPLLFLIILCGISFVVIAKQSLVFADAPSFADTFIIRVEADSSLSVEVKDNEFFVSLPKPLTLYYVTKQCASELSPEKLAPILSEVTPCSDAIVSVSATQTGQYTFNPTDTGYLVMAYCDQAELDCVSHPNEFKVLSLSEIQKQEMSEGSHQLLSITQIQL
jgi:hypothetical protein